MILKLLLVLGPEMEVLLEVRPSGELKRLRDWSGEGREQSVAVTPLTLRKLLWYNWLFLEDRLRA